VIPLREPGDEDAVEVFEYSLHRLAALRCARGKRRANLTGRDLSEDRAVVQSTGEIVGDPVHELMARLPERLGVHVAEVGRKGLICHPISIEHHGTGATESLNCRMTRITRRS
jgi:hypothetical protein